MTMVVAVASRHGVAVSADSFALDKATGQYNTTARKLFFAGPAIIGVALAGYPGGDPEKYFDDFTATCPADHSVRDVFDDLVVKVKIERVLATLLVAGFDHDGTLHIYRRIPDVGPEEVLHGECGYVCIGCSSMAVPLQAGDLDTLDAAAALSQTIIRDEIARAAHAQEPQCVAEPLNTYTGTPQHWTAWTERR